MTAKVVTRLRVRVADGYDLQLPLPVGHAPAGTELIVSPGEMVDRLLNTGAIEVVERILSEVEGSEVSA